MRERRPPRVCAARETVDAMTTTKVTLRVYDLRCDEETKRRASKTHDIHASPRGGAMTTTTTTTIIVSREVDGD